MTGKRERERERESHKLLVFTSRCRIVYSRQRETGNSDVYGYCGNHGQKMITTAISVLDFVHHRCKSVCSVGGGACVCAEQGGRGVENTTQNIARN